MNLKSYLNLYELLQNDTSTHEENRAFGLAHAAVKNKPIEQLVAWSKVHRAKLKKPLLSETFSSYLYGVTLTLVLLAFVLGLFSGVGLLSYSGHEPVNVIYFMVIVIFFPLFTMMLAFISMYRAGSAQSVLVHLSPAFWMEKLLGFLPHKMEENIKTLKINPLLANWIVIKRSQLIALFFSLGLLFALLAVVVTKDIAFAWSTTLELSPEAFHHFLYTLSFPWLNFYPSAVPSIELIEQSQYFRLGDKLSEEMIGHASQLGEWWKFLACATVFYAVVLRFGCFLLTSFGLKKAIKKSFLTLPGVIKILKEMNEPIILTHVRNDENTFVPGKASYGQTVNTLDTSYDVAQGWAIPSEQLAVINESMQVISPKQFEVGGMNSFAEDNEILAQSHGKVLLYVKGWEPPTMDFIDYLSELEKKTDKVIVMPLGTAANGYKTTAKELDIWERKLSLLNAANVWLKR